MKYTVHIHVHMHMYINRKTIMHLHYALYSRIPTRVEWQQFKEKQLNSTESTQNERTRYKNNNKQPIVLHTRTIV